MRLALSLAFLLLPLAATGLQAQMMTPSGALSASGLATVYSAPTVSDFLGACQRDRAGCMDAVGNVMMQKIHFDGSDGICLTSMNYGTQVPQWLIAHPGLAQAATADGVFAALKALYPC